MLGGGQRKPPARSVRHEVFSRDRRNVVAISVIFIDIGKFCCRVSESITYRKFTKIKNRTSQVHLQERNMLMNKADRNRDEALDSMITALGKTGQSTPVNTLRDKQRGKGRLRRTRVTFSTDEKQKEKKTGVQERSPRRKTAQRGKVERRTSMRRTRLESGKDEGIGVRAAVGSRILDQDSAETLETIASASTKAVSHNDEEPLDSLEESEEVGVIVPAVTEDEGDTDTAELQQIGIAETETPFLEPEKEREIIRRVQAGDSNAFDDIVNAYQRKAYYVASQFVNNHEDAMDLAQDAFVKAFKAINSFNINSPFFPWFYKIIKNHCLNYIKKSGRVRNDSLEELEEDQFMQFKEERADPRTQYAGDEERQQLWEALWRMWMTKPDFAEIISLKHFHNSSYKEIAAVLDIPIGTVMSRLFNARQDLRERYLEVVSEKN